MCESFHKTTAVLIALLALAVPRAEGQAVYGTLIGTVLDSSGAVVPAARVTIIDVNKGTVLSTSTNESGNYTQAQLTPGTYKVSIDKQGFKTFSQQNVTVTVGLSTRVDATLLVGAASQEVTVKEAPPGIETDRAEVTTSMSNQQITELPVLNRNFTNLTLLVPGAALNTFQHAPSENPQGSTLVNTNGQEFAGTNYLLDGMNNNDAVLGILMVNPAIDSVAESSIATSNYDAEFTQAGGAVVRVETKSGSNAFHGSLFEFLQNDALEARDPFTQGLKNVPNSGVPELRWNQFGGSAGGPIIKDKLFWFGDYQGTRRRIGASETVRVPTLAERSGNLSDLSVPIFDPTTGNPDGTGRLQFPGNVIPRSQMSAPATKLLGFLPKPNLSPSNPADNNYITNAVENYDTDQLDVRMDHYVTDKLRYFGRYSYLGANITAPGPFGLYGGPAFPAWGFTGASDAGNQNLAVSTSYTFSPNFLTEFRYGFSRYRVTVSSLDANKTLANQAGIPGLNIQGRPDTFGLPDLNINGTGGFQMGYRCNCPLHQRESLNDFVSNWTKIAGNHTFKWGATVELAWNQRLPSDDHRAGVYDFDPSVTSLAPSLGGLGLASFLLGAPDHFRRFSQVSTTQEDRQDRVFYFAQDTWRLTPKLTLGYGLRWDTWFPDFSLNNGQGGRYDVTDNLVRIPGIGGISKSANSQIQWTNFSPRASLAYALNPKTVVRTGYGRSYFQGTFGWTFNNLAADIYPSIVTQDLRGPSPFFPVFGLATAPPAVVFPAIPANGLLRLPNGIGDAYIPANQKIPYVDQWNFTVERQIATNLDLSMGYVGNIGRHLNGGFNLNAAAPGPGDFDPRRPLFRKFGIEQSIFDKCDCTSSNYNALQIRAEKRMGTNYTLLAAYTYSRTYDFGEFGTPTNQYNANSDYGPASFDRSQVFTLAHTYYLPFGKGRRYLSDLHGVAGMLLGGWQFNGITTVESGLPFSPTLNNNASLNSDMSLRPNEIGDPLRGISQNRNEWFNPLAYAVPAPFKFGNAKRDSLRGPGLFTADWALAKDFSLTERYKLQFRWENFNVLNRTNLALPDSAVDSGTAGKIFDIASPMRNMQMALRLTF